MVGMDGRAVLDDWAPAYRKFHRTPFVQYYVEPNVRKMLGSIAISGKSALDIGCGEGYYSRLLKSMGATRVVGVDISNKMIQLARNQEQQEPLGIEYIISDIVEANLEKRFDVVMFILVLAFAKDRQHLLEMCKKAYEQLSPGGRLIAITSHVSTQSVDSDFTKYGFDYRVTGFRNGEAIVRLQLRFSDNSEDCPPPAEMLAFTKETFETVLKQAGFEEVTLQPLTVSSVSPEPYDEEFWNFLLKSEVFQQLTAKKN